MRAAPGLQPFVPRDIEHEYGGPAERDLDRIGHVELARLHDRRHRADVLRSCVTRLADRGEHILDLRLLDTDEDRRVALLEEATLRLETGDAVLLVREGVDKRARVLGMHDRDHELHTTRMLREGAEQAVDLATDIGADRGFVAVTIDHDPAPRLGSGEPAIPLPHALVEVGCEHLEAIPFRGGAPAGASKGDLDRDVEEERAIGNEARDSERRDIADRLERDAVPVALVRERRVEVAIRDDDRAGVERGPDHVAHELRARGAVEQYLGFRRERRLLRVQQDLADPLARGRAAGLPREDDLASALAEPASKLARLQGFSGALTSLERKEETPLHR